MPEPHLDPTREAPARRALLIGLALGAVFLIAAAVAIWQVSHDGAASDRPAVSAAGIAVLR